MPLIELDPPSTLPRGQWIARPAVPAEPSAEKFQFTTGCRSSFSTPAGIWIQMLRSGGPASSRITRAPVSERRLAMTQPAEPAPITT